MEQSQELLNQQPVILKDPFQQGRNASSSNPKTIGGIENDSSVVDQSYIIMV